MYALLLSNEEENQMTKQTKFVYCPICKHPMGNYPNVDGKCWNCNVLIKFTIIKISNNESMEKYI